MDNFFPTYDKFWTGRYSRLVVTLPKIYQSTIQDGHKTLSCVQDVTGIMINRSWTASADWMTSMRRANNILATTCQMIAFHSYTDHTHTHSFIHTLIHTQADFSQKSKYSCMYYQWCSISHTQVPQTLKNKHMSITASSIIMSAAQSLAQVSIDLGGHSCNP